MRARISSAGFCPCGDHVEAGALQLQPVLKEEIVVVIDQ
jgi:hypothetical protein